MRATSCTESWVEELVEQRAEMLELARALATKGDLHTARQVRGLAGRTTRTLNLIAYLTERAEAEQRASA